MKQCGSVSEELDFFRSSKNPVESGVQQGTETDGRKEMCGRTGYQGGIIMASFDITSFIQNNVSTLAPIAQAVAGTVVGAMLLRKKTGVETGTIEFEKIKAGKFSEAVDILLESGKITYTEFFKMKNYSDIAKKADEIRIESVKDLPQQDFDWHIRFYEACGTVTDEEMQELWAKILSGEICHPGSYSLRTLECLRNLTKEEAELFRKICGCGMKLNSSVAMLRIGGIMEKNGITYDNILKLADCGLLKSDVGLALGLTVGEELCILAVDDSMVLLVNFQEGSILLGDTKIESGQIIKRDASDSYWALSEYNIDINAQSADKCYGTLYLVIKDYQNDYYSNMLVYEFNKNDFSDYTVEKYLDIDLLHI